MVGGVGGGGGVGDNGYALRGRAFDFCHSCD